MSLLMPHTPFVIRTSPSSNIANGTNQQSSDKSWPSAFSWLPKSDSLYKLEDFLLNKNIAHVPRNTKLSPPALVEIVQTTPPICPCHITSAMHTPL